MKAIGLADKRRFSLESVQTVPVVDSGDLRLELLCFEAGQKTGEFSHNGTTVYQVTEGEAIVRSASGREQAGAGRILSVAPGVTHTVENAGGGLLSVLVTSHPTAE